MILPASKPSICIIPQLGILYLWVEQSFTLYMLNPHSGTPYWLLTPIRDVLQKYLFYLFYFNCRQTQIMIFYSKIFLHKKLKIYLVLMLLHVSLSTIFHRDPGEEAVVLCQVKFHLSAKIFRGDLGNKCLLTISP